MSGPPPDKALVVNQPPKPGMPVRRIHLACAELIVPASPPEINFIISRDSGRARLLKLNMRRFPVAWETPIISSTSSALSAGGFSQKTCFPACIHWIASGAWNLLGTIILTASQPEFSSISSTLSNDCAMSYFSAAVAAAPGATSATATISPPPCLNPAA